MKKHLRKLPLFASLFLLFIMSCSKQEDPVIIEESPIFTLVISEFTPGDIVEIKSNKTLMSSDIDIVLNNSTIKAYKMNDFSYVFTLPVIASGKYDLKLPTINKDLILDLTVKTYTPITNPTEVIAAYIVTRNKCFDEMSKNNSVLSFKTSPETLQIIEQIKQEWDFQFNKSSDKDKELLAYALQKQQISTDWFNFPNDLPANYFAKTNGVQNDVGDKLVTYAKTYITAQVVCVKSIPATLGTGAIFLIAPNPITAGLFLVSFTTFIVSKEVAERNALAVGSLKGVAEAVTDFSFQKTAALELINNFEKNISMSINFRNLKSTDSGIQSDISAAFTGENELEAKDNEVKALYQKATSFTQKLKGLFSSYTPAIGKTSERNIIFPVLGSDIIIKSSSDPNVTVSTKMVGTNRVIIASSTSSQDINFNLKVAYKRKIDGQEVVKDIACVFKAINCNTSTLAVTATTTADNATATASGGQAPYTYAWSNGAIGVSATSLTDGGKYTVTVTDALGCTKKSNEVIVNVCSSQNKAISITSDGVVLCPLGLSGGGGCMPEFEIQFSYTAQSVGFPFGGSYFGSYSASNYPVNLEWQDTNGVWQGNASNSYKVYKVNGDQNSGTVKIKFINSGCAATRVFCESTPPYERLVTKNWKYSVTDKCGLVSNIIYFTTRHYEYGK